MITRRTFFATGAAAAVLSGGGTARAADEMKLNLAAYDKIAPVKFPWGWIRWVMNAEIDPKAEITVGIVLLEANQKNQLHIHPNSQEVLHVLSGACEHLVGEVWHKIAAGDTLLIPKDTPHQARTGDGPFLAMISYNTGNRVMVPVTDAAVK
jgi:quercetin dioxygenase-like cupin family protein